MTSRWEDGGRIVWWSAVTGRHAVVEPATVAAVEAGTAPEPVLRRLRELGLVGEPDVARLIPCRSRLVLTLAEGLWYPDPEVRTAGGHGFRLLALSGPERRVWDAVDDSRTTEGVARQAGVALETVVAFLGTLTTPDRQIVQLRPRPGRRDPALGRLLTIPRPASARSADQHDGTGATTLLAYHLDGITDGATHFDDRETTIAHALAVPHPALGGRPYGLALHDALARRGLVRGTIVEIGGGTGELAASFWAAARDAGRRWVRVDLSPELLRTQARRVDAPGILADAVRLPFRDGCVDLVVANEVIADLSAAPASSADVQARIGRYGVPVGDVVNVGAWRLLEELARILAPGGAAYLSEFGSPDDEPEEAVQLDHPEVGIHFGQLAAVARALGLEADVVPLAELLGLRLDARQLARHSHEALRARFRAEGLHLPARAWTPDALAAVLPWPVEGLDWVPMTEPGPGPLVTRFWALIVRRS